MKKLTVFILVSAFLVGCGGGYMGRTRTNLENQGHPKPYIDGYMHGCSSGASAAGSLNASFAKDVKRFGQDQLYAQGWNDGYAYCKSDHESYQRLTGARR